MTPVAEFVGRRSEELGLDQKAVAARFHDALQRSGGGASAVAFTTVEPKLSKLLKGRKEGMDFFLGKPDRVEALAEALRVPLRDLEELVEMGTRHRLLLLDPVLPEEALAYYTARAENLEHCSSVRVPAAEASVEALRGACVIG